MCIVYAYAKGIQKVPPVLGSNLWTWISLETVWVQPRWAVWKPTGTSWENLSGVNLLSLLCVLLYDWKLLDRPRQSNILIPLLPFMILHASSWDHYLKHCLQLIFKAACNQPKATRLGFQTVTNAGVWDIEWGRLGRQLAKWSSFLGQNRLLCVMSWDMKTWGHRIWANVFLDNVSDRWGGGRRRGTRRWKRPDAGAQ